MTLTPTKKEQAQLDALTETIPLNLPVHVLVNQDRSMVNTLLIDEQALATLSTFSITKQRLIEHMRWLDLLAHAQGKWHAVYTSSHNRELNEVIERGYEHRAHGAGPARYHLSRDPQAIEALDRIQDGEGHDDMAQDLLSLAALIERHEAAFEGDPTFDAKDYITQARALYDTLSDARTDAHDEAARAEIKRRRDQLYTLVARTSDEIRDAGRYAFRDDDERGLVFRNAYRSRTRSKKTREATSPDTPPQT